MQKFAYNKLGEVHTRMIRRWRRRKKFLHLQSKHRRNFLRKKKINKRHSRCSLLWCICSSLETVNVFKSTLTFYVRAWRLLCISKNVYNTKVKSCASVAELTYLCYNLRVHRHNPVESVTNLQQWVQYCTKSYTYCSCVRPK